MADVPGTDEPHMFVLTSSTLVSATYILYT